MGRHSNPPFPNPDFWSRNSTDSNEFWGYDNGDNTTTWYDPYGCLDSITRTPNEDDDAFAIFNGTLEIF